MKVFVFTWSPTPDPFQHYIVIILAHRQQGDNFIFVHLQVSALKGSVAHANTARLGLSMTISGTKSILYPAGNQRFLSKLENLGKTFSEI
jgi:hypothetical protein